MIDSQSAALQATREKLLGEKVSRCGRLHTRTVVEVYG